MIAVRTQFTADDLAGRDLRGAARGRSSAPSRCRPATYNRKVDRDRARRGSPSSSELAAQPASTRRRTPATGALQLGIARLGQPLHRGDRSTRRTGCGCSCTRARAASATRSPSTTSRSRRSGAAAAAIELPDRDLAYLVEGTRGVRRATSRELRWAQQFALLNREEMMDRVVAPASASAWATPVVERRADQLPPQLHPARDALRQRGVGVAQGRDRGDGGASRA